MRRGEEQVVHDLPVVSRRTVYSTRSGKNTFRVFTAPRVQQRILATAALHFMSLCWVISVMFKFLRTLNWRRSALSLYPLKIHRNRGMAILCEIIALWLQNQFMFNCDQTILKSYSFPSSIFVTVVVQRPLCNNTGQ